MWKTPQKSPGNTTANSTGLASARSDQPMMEQTIPFPQLITENPEYVRLYEKIYKSQQKVYVAVSQEEQKQTLNNIKQTITEKLKLKEKQSSFQRKFGKPMSYSARKVMKNDFKNLLGLTRQQQNDYKLNNFLMNHKNAVELQQQARLAEYHLRDQESARSKVDYLNRIEQTSKHRRTAPDCRDREQKLFKINNQLSFHVMRKTAYIRNDKFMSKAIVNAQNNPTFRRMKNFSQIQYILKQDSQNLMITHEIPKNMQKQKVYNITRKLFLSMALASDSLRTYYDFIKEKQFAKVAELIVPENENQRVERKLTDEYIFGLINKIIKYKQNKVIHFQDFNQILKTVHQQKGYDILSIIVNDFEQNRQKSRYRRLLVSSGDEQIQANRTQVKQLLKKHKMEVLARKIYELNGNKIISREYLPLRDIVQFMKSVNIVPKIITMSKFMHTCFWHQMRREGFSSEEFISIQVALGWDLEGTLEGVDTYFRMFNISEIFTN